MLETQSRYQLQDPLWRFAPYPSRLFLEAGETFRYPRRIRQDYAFNRPEPSSRVWVTVVTNDAYVPGALVLAHSLKTVKSRYPLVILVTRSPQLSKKSRDTLSAFGLFVREIEPLYLDRSRHDPSITERRFEDSWNKLRAFELLEYERVVLLDSDMLVKKNMDELFDVKLKPHEIAAVHACACNPFDKPYYPNDWVPANCAFTGRSSAESLTSGRPIRPDSPRTHRLLNSGLVVLQPSNDLATEILQFLETSTSLPHFVLPDQDTLAAVFEGRWKPLPFIYNTLKPLKTAHKSIWRCDSDIKCLHYILEDKPWLRRPSSPPQQGEKYDEELKRWWWASFDDLIIKLRGKWSIKQVAYIESLVASKFQ